MRFRLVEENEQREKYSGWNQEDIDLYESIDWDEQGDEDYDAGCAYLDSAVKYEGETIDRATTEFHKFFKKDPYTQPYYKPVEKNPFSEYGKDCGEPVSNGKMHKEYQVYSEYDM